MEGCTTLLPEETIRQPLVDAICIGEGEGTLPEYLERLQGRQEPKAVSGIWYKDAEGNIVRNTLRPFRDDLDYVFFPNWDHWDMERYLKRNLYFDGGMRYLFSRGCPYSCRFCSNPAIRKAVPGRFYRKRSPENVIEEIKQNKTKYYAKGFRYVVFGDETFGFDIEHLAEFCFLYRKQNSAQGTAVVLSDKGRYCYGRMGASRRQCRMLHGNSGD